MAPLSYRRSCGASGPRLVAARQWGVAGPALLLVLLASPSIRVVPAGVGAGPVPALCGSLRADGVFARRAADRGIVDGAGRPVVACVHRFGERALLCALLPDTGATTLRLASRRARVPRLEVGRAGAGFRIDTGARVLQCTVGGTLFVGGLSVGPVAGRAGAGRWRVAHRCRARVTLVHETPAGVDRLRRHWMVTAYAGASRVDVALWAVATAPVVLTGGIGMELHGPSLRGVRAEGDTGVVTVRSDSWAISVWSGLEDLVVDGESVRLLGEPVGTTLDGGEGRIVRAALLPGCTPASPPAWILPRECVTRAGGGTHLAQAPLSPGVDGAAARLVARLLDDDEHGLIRTGTGRGDWRFDRERVGNGEYDTTLGLVQWARRTGSVDAWVAARRMADHLLTHARDASGSGLFFPHGRGHRSSAVEAGHHWLEGLELLNVLEPDPLRGAILAEVRLQQARSLGALDLDRQIPRSLGWGLLALSVAMAREGPHRDATRDALRRWRRHVLDTQTRSGLLALVPLAGDEDLGHENPFVQGGIILPALVRSLWSLPSSTARRATRRLARALGDHATHVDQGTRVLPLRLTIDARSGRVLARSGRAPGEHAALFLAGLASADRDLPSRPGLHDLLRTVPHTLRADRKTYIGAEVSILLRSLPWLARH